MRISKVWNLDFSVFDPGLNRDLGRDNDLPAHVQINIRDVYGVDVYRLLAGCFSDIFYSFSFKFDKFHLFFFDNRPPSIELFDIQFLHEVVINGFTRLELSRLIRVHIEV